MSSREAKASAGDRWPATEQLLTSGSQLKEGEAAGDRVLPPGNPDHVQLRWGLTSRVASEN